MNVSAFPKNIACFTLLAVGLVGPFVLLKSSHMLEPVPAILLPSGAVLAKVGGDEIAIKTVTAWGRRSADEDWQAIHPVELIDPVPVQYFEHLARKGFGLMPDVGKTVQLPGFGRTAKLPSRVSEQDSAETNRWFRERLTELGFAPGAFRVTVQQEVFRFGDDSPRLVAPLHEQIYQLE